MHAARMLASLLALTLASAATGDAAADVREGELPVAQAESRPELINPANPKVELLPPVEPIEPPPRDVAGPLTVADVVAAIYASYPGLEAARRERQIASGEALEAMGAFDTQLSAESLNEALGFYENYRQGVVAKQYAWGGSQVFGGYRVGRGIFEPWYLERETNKGGEFKAGFAIPLLRDRDIDKRRAAVFKSRLQRQAAEPLVQMELIDAVLSGSSGYWDWVAAGQHLEIARTQLEIAQGRQEKLRTAVELGAIKGIELVDNERLIVSRQAKVIDAERKLQQASIKLSIYLRSFDGIPLLGTPDQLPSGFPQIGQPDFDMLPDLISQALAMRPELQLLTIASRKASVELQQARNMMLPDVNAVMTASQDVGEPTSSKRDKSELELEAGFVVDVPLQRRAARGQIQAAQGKIAQIAAKRRLAEQKIAADVRSLMVALAADYLQIEQAQESVKLSQRMVDAELEKFRAGNSNILLIYVRERDAFEAQLLVVDARADYFKSLAALQAAIAEELVGRSLPIIRETSNSEEARDPGAAEAGRRDDE